MHSRMQAYTLVGYFIMFGDYAWQRAVPEDEAYDCFVEGRHIEAKPWKSMPAPILQFYNAGLDGRREARATIDELLDMVDSCDFAAQINTMRDLLGRNEAPSDAETVAMKKLNQSDNWKVSVKVLCEIGCGYTSLAVVVHSGWCGCRQQRCL
eukprot:m.325872 g.325872  ORF g.325872 m.325872 type:complete len:152 (+) comp20391_c0_seq1:1206-1661(+)